ncbi:metal-sensitive transcriptional regulator, partial [Amycolatopsis lurida]|uniref:metal-sensitive transcriptional regulator n=1 Tax=Amycolatopsis lurida TaxID=31959 RepID=UPI0036583BB8
HGYHDQKSEHLKRLRRIEGQIRGLQRLVDEDVYCIDILTQVSASTSRRSSALVPPSTPKPPPRRSTSEFRAAPPGVKSPIDRFDWSES